MIEITAGPWRVVARLAYWDEKGDGVAIVHDTRRRVDRVFIPLYRFPIGWRCSAVESSGLPKYVQAAVRRAARTLP